MKVGGRAKGVPNRTTQILQDKAAELEVDPFEILLRFAKGDWKGLKYSSPTETRYTPSGESYEKWVIEPELRAKCAADACQYLHPKRKAIEHSGLDSSPLERYLLMTEDERKRLREEYEKRLSKVK
jgi:hypothetical protein